MDSLWGYAIAGYVVTGATVSLYVVHLFRRARRAGLRAAAIAAKDAT